MQLLKHKLGLILCCLVLAASSFTTQAQERASDGALIPMEDFFKNPEKTRYQISPDGEYFSFMAPYENRLNIHVQKVGSAEAVRITSETERDPIDYYWANDNRILYFKDDGGNENFKIIGVDKDGGNLKDLTPFDSVTIQFIDELRDFPDELIIGLNNRDKRIFDPYRLNIVSGELTQLAENPGNITSWLTDHNGQIRVATATDGVNSIIMHREAQEDPFEIVLTTNFKETVTPLFFTFDNKNIYAISDLGRDKTSVVEYDLTEKKEVRELFAHPDVDIGGLSYSKKRKVLTSSSYTTWKRERHFFDDHTADIYKRLGEALPGYEIVISSENREEDKFLIRTYSDRSLGAYYFFDYNAEQLVELAKVSPWLNEDDLCEMKPIEYTARDGMKIPGYLTLPKNYKEGTPIPLIVNPHGGPWARDNWGYRSDVQFLASRGYAVFQPNFRGSIGYGKAFWTSSFKQWGRTMQDDITDGVHWLIEQGIADKEKVAIYGASYGGYATLMGIVKTPELYAAAVDYVGVSNMFTFMGTIPPYWEPYRQMFYEMVGNPGVKEDSLMLAEVSPVFHVDRIQTPLLIAQGKNDPRVNVDESDQMVEALNKRGVEVQYIMKENEGHGFRNEENRFEFYGAMEDFLEKYLK